MAIPFLLYNFVNSECPLYLSAKTFTSTFTLVVLAPQTSYIMDIYMIKRGFLGWKQGSWATDNSSGIISIISLCMSLFAPGFKWWSSSPSLVRRHRRLLCDSMEPIEDGQSIWWMEHRKTPHTASPSHEKDCQRYEVFGIYYNLFR